MTGAQEAETPRPRIGLVLGAGGIAGGAFHAGVLAAISAVTGWDPRTAAMIVGTSAGSATAASLRAGLSAPDLLARATGQAVSQAGAELLASAGEALRPPVLRSEGGARPTRAQIAAMLQQAARRPFSARPLAILASLVPDGTVDTGFIASALSTFVDNAWPADPMWICAVRQRDGRRVVFGRDTSPAVPLAVAASCAIPRVFRPVIIDDDSYIDGGAHSPTNADLLATSGLDLVLVSSPMSIASRQLRLSTDQPFRQWSRLLLDSELVRIRRRGTTVMAFQPNQDDLSVIGLSAMDPDRRGPIALQAYASTCHRLSRADVRQRLAPLGGR